MSRQRGIVAAALVAAAVVVPAASAGTSGDTTPPETTITGGPSGLIADQRPTFTFTSSEQSGRFLCRLDDGPGAFACTSPYRVPRLSDGPHSFEVQAEDAAGNADPTPARRSYRVDATAPRVRLIERPPWIVRTRGERAVVEFSFSTGDRNATLACAIDIAALESCESPLRTSLPFGRHRFRVHATDRAGNRSPAGLALFNVVEVREPGEPVACSQFASQAAAQHYLVDNAKVPGSGAARLDADRDGVACDGLGSPFRVVLSLGYNRRGDFLFGYVHAPDVHFQFDSPRDCWYSRRVEVRQEMAGADPLVTRTRVGAFRGSDTVGIWKAPVGEVEGRLYALIRPDRRPYLGGCLGGVSPTRRF